MNKNIRQFIPLAAHFSFQSLKSRLVSCVIAVAIAGCSSTVNLNMGETDYRVAIPHKDGATENVQLIGKYESDPSLPARIITKDQTVSVHLKQVFIDNFSERVEKFFASILTTTVRGEIAVVARVFEFGDGETIDFRQSSLENKGRLIYYTEDVRTGGHLLNQSMLPVYGPIKYNGKPLFMQFTVLELDVKEAGQIKSLLGVLAGLGAKAYAPASPVLKSLDAIGSQLLSGEQDDIEFQYSFVLYPEGGRDQFAKYPHISTGDYLLVRVEPNQTYTEEGQNERFNTIDWERNFKYCPENGRLMKTEPGCTCENLINSTTKDSCEFRENTYLVVQVNSGFSSVGLDVTQAFLEFQQEIEQEIGKQDIDSDKMKEELIAEFDEYLTQAEFSDTRAKIERFHSAAVQALKAACGSVNDREAQRYFAELYDLYVTKRDFPDGLTDFSQSQWTRMLYAMRELSNAPYEVTKGAVEDSGDAKILAETVINCRSGN